MLRENIMELFTISSCQTFEQMIDRDHDQEIEYELKKKRKAAQVQTIVVSAKKYGTSNP